MSVLPTCRTLLLTSTTGLSQAAVHKTDLRGNLNHLFSVINQSGNTITNLSRGIAKLSTTEKSGKHALEIIGEVLKDSRLDLRERLKSMPPQQKYHTVVGELSDIITAYSKQWIVDGNDAKDVQEKTEQIFWLQSLIYGVGGFSTDKPFVGDFVQYDIHILIR